ncbi:hypothetical protein [Rhizobium sp. BK602]|uniref:hypothetical protein n=1 Tax=Rhizobium sp. BK602 TaxID=2586986 RepID=UPI001608BD92|nr:hypothetical protein [Rhizobium sp. BK602]MBB3611142.1 hypothetical protein [Rhizobium sp. BK602]
MTRKTAVIIGNGKLHRDLSGIVDNADFAMRFNAPNLSSGMSGTRTDILMLAASSKSMQRRLADPAFWDNVAFKAAREVMLVYHPGIIRKYHPKPNMLSRLRGRRADWTMQAIELIGSAGKEVRVMPPQFYLSGCAALGVTESRMRDVFPSTGFLGICHALTRLPAGEWDVKLCGFSWEGWKRHAWQDERRWVEGKIANGLISMIG